MVEVSKSEIARLSKFVSFFIQWTDYPNQTIFYLIKKNKLFLFIIYSRNREIIVSLFFEVLCLVVGFYQKILVFDLEGICDYDYLNFQSRRFMYISLETLNLWRIVEHESLQYHSITTKSIIILIKKFFIDIFFCKVN